MKFVDNLNEKEYTEFWKNSKNAHFLNAYWWGIANKDTRKQNPIYVGIKDDNNNILCETMLLKRSTPLNMCYYYAPRGYLIDWNNTELVSFFTEKLKLYLKQNNGIYLKIDPAISYQDVNDKAIPIENGNNNYKLFNYLLSLGYVHKGFNKLYERNQPRYTFRTIFKNYESFDDVEKGISKTFMRSIKRSYNYDLDIKVTNNINSFYELANKVSLKDGFKVYPKKYYEDIFSLYYKNGYIKNFEAYIDTDKIIDKFNKMVAVEKNQDRINKLKKDIEYFNSQDKGYNVIASLICIYTEKGAWSLYIGNNGVAEYTGTVNRLYYEFIKDAYNNKYDFADLFGVCGDPITKFKNLAGIFEYKRKLGGTCLEYMGEFDLVNKKFWYKVLPIMLNIYRKIKR